VFGTDLLDGSAGGCFNSGLLCLNLLRYARIGCLRESALSHFHAGAHRFRPVVRDRLLADRAGFAENMEVSFMGLAQGGLGRGHC
jgi:hypothetical protein